MGGVPAGRVYLLKRDERAFLEKREQISGSSDLSSRASCTSRVTLDVFP